MKTFHGGVHPSEEKQLTEDLAFEVIPSASQIILPLTQHLGQQAKPIIKKGSVVVNGELIAEADGSISAPIYSPVCGTVASVGKHETVNGFPKDSIVINTNGHSEKKIMSPLDPQIISSEDIRKRVAEAGIVGQGGAAFPTSVKLTPPKDKVINLVILNGCECEPYLTRDYRFMVERPEAVISGMKLIMKALCVKNGIIGIEHNKPKAVEKIKSCLNEADSIQVYVLKTKYPQGAEKMLIKAATGKEVPIGKLPHDVGIVVQNVGTAVSVNDAVVKGEPLVTAALTVSGKGIKNPKNVIVTVGTPILTVLDYCGGVTEDAARIVVGGPMMGVAQFNLLVPIMKATSGIVVLTRKEVEEKQETPCLRCGQCIDACPLNLMPTKLARYTQLEKYEEAESISITTCMECGTCAFTCPANIPLVQWIRLGKQKVNQLLRTRAVAK